MHRRSFLQALGAGLASGLAVLRGWRPVAAVAKAPAVQPLAAAGTRGLLMLKAGENLEFGDLVIIDHFGKAVKADRVYIGWVVATSCDPEDRRVTIATWGSSCASPS